MTNTDATWAELKIGAVNVKIPNIATQTLEVDGKWLVMFDPLGLPTRLSRRNVWCFTPAGELLWKIQAAPYYNKNLRDSWAQIKIKDGHVRISELTEDRHSNWLDVETGRVYSSPGVPLSDEPDQE